MSEALLTPADLAEQLRITERQVLDLRRAHSWPCVRLSRKSIRFTADQADEIVRRHVTEAPAVAADTSGLTKQSRKRAS